MEQTQEDTLVGMDEGVMCLFPHHIAVCLRCWEGSLFRLIKFSYRTIVKLTRERWMLEKSKENSKATTTGREATKSWAELADYGNIGPVWVTSPSI